MTAEPRRRTTIMGVLNVTPDSFSDGGAHPDASSALEAGAQMFADGATIVDVGGESTRPGAEPVAVDVELDRVLDVVAALATHGRVSIDTRKHDVAVRAVEAGATVINDVGATLAPLAGELGVGYVAMHSVGTPGTMQRDPQYDDVVVEVLGHVVRVAEAARAAGATEVWIDPGLGFGKTVAHNYTLLAHIADFVATGFPVLVGASRKSFVGRVLAESDGVADVGFDDRLEGSLAITAWSAMNEVDLVRVHDVPETLQTLQVVAA
jgi:dihydropteroate synthase